MEVGELELLVDNGVQEPFTIILKNVDSVNWNSQGFFKANLSNGQLHAWRKDTIMSMKYQREAK